jgi:hypothetical protein
MQPRVVPVTLAGQAAPEGSFVTSWLTRNADQPIQRVRARRFDGARLQSTSGCGAAQPRR